MWTLVVVCVLGVVRQVEGYESYQEDYYTKDVFTEAPVIGGRQRSLDSASSVDELLELLYPEYSLVQHCLRRKSQRDHAPSPHADDDPWGLPRHAAVYRPDGTFEIILEEMQRTACRPREVCVEVNKEYPENTSHFYLPRCVALLRCGGCCNHEALYCTNTSHTHANKTLLEVSSPKMERSVVTLSFINHTSCECLPKRPLHSIIRRAAAEHLALCSPPDVPCAPGLLWDPGSCMCVSSDASPFSPQELDSLDSALLVLCGPNKVLDEGSCECVCRNGLTEASCVSGWRLDQDSCECQCEGQPAQGTCPPNQRWDPQLCGCVCRAACPPRQPLNPETCLCQCRENPQTCLLQGKKFNPNSCSCYRLPCRKPHRSCQSGFYYSQYVCQCIPSYMREHQWN
ncbi:vascular endothelial growth factor C-like [Osmerus mordax]|uniref:vascular endothelial growth factor C-like n=1 Tax=Osmerus mordax TaxID=8014 RepID=UPI00351048D6